MYLAGTGKSARVAIFDASNVTRERRLEVYADIKKLGKVRGRGEGGAREGEVALRWGEGEGESLFDACRSIPGPNRLAFCSRLKSSSWRSSATRLSCK